MAQFDKLQSKIDDENLKLNAKAQEMERENRGLRDKMKGFKKQIQDAKDAADKEQQQKFAKIENLDVNIRQRVDQM